VTRALLVVALTVALPAVAAAQTADQKAAAQALFDEGSRLFNAGDFAAACGKLEASLAIVDAVGTRGKLAQCFEKVGRTASAWAMWREVAVLAGRAGQARRQQFAQDRAKALEPNLAYLTVDVPADSQVPGLVVKRAGSVVFSGAFGTPIAVDPGDVAVEASAPGYKPWSETVSVSAAKRETVTVPALEAEPVAVEPPTSDKPAVADLTTTVAPSGSNTKKIIGITGVGVGAASIAVGLIFGAAANSTYDDAFEDPDGMGPMMACAEGRDGEPVCPNMDEQRRVQGIVDDANSQATLANVFTIAGIGIAAGGAVLWILSGSSDDGPTERGVTFVPTAGRDSAGFAVSGRF